MLNVRNIAIIAHVDHGKTTLVDALLKQSHVFRDNEEEMQQSCILDSNELERERGITILAKNAAISYKGVKINIIDTPGHADFSGEVERTLDMADGAVLIVDAQEGPMPQTRFVLRKAFELGLKVIVVINKIDKQFAKVSEVDDKIQSLFLELATKDDQLDYPTLYAIGRTGKTWKSMPTDFNEAADVEPLLETVIATIPSPDNDSTKSFKMLVSSLDYDSYLGRIAIGRIQQGVAHPGDRIVVAGTGKSFSMDKVMINDGIGRKDVAEAFAGDIVAITGIEGIQIGQTIANSADTEALPSAELTEPTLHMTVGPNTSPFAGKEGEFTTSRQIENRLMRELEVNLSLRVEKLEGGKFKISGRGELHLAVLLETLRREGFELEVGKPEVIEKTIDGVKSEPVEEVNIITHQDYLGVITQEIGKRFGSLKRMGPINDSEMEFVYEMPTRAIIGLRSILLTATRGDVVFNSVFVGFKPSGEALTKLRKGVLISSETGEALTYGLSAAQQRGITFIDAGSKVYEGMIVGQNAKDEDIEINVTKGKKLTNMRAASGDQILQISPPTILSLEQCLDFLEPDELLEITPISLRLRKRFLTDIERRRHRRA